MYKCCAVDSKGLILGCKRPVLARCLCRRCNNEPEHRFYTCPEHQFNVSKNHTRIYGSPPSWEVFRSDCRVTFLELENDWGGAKQW